MKKKPRQVSAKVTDYEVKFFFTIRCLRDFEIVGNHYYAFNMFLPYIVL